MSGGSPPAEIRNSRSPDRLQKEICVTSTEMADIDICKSPDTLQTEWSATYTEMAGGSPPADRDICDGPDRLQTEISVITPMMSGGSPPADIRNSRSPDRLQKEICVTSTEMACGSPPAHIDICESPDLLQTVISVTSTEMAGGNSPADRDNCESPELLQRAGSVTAVVPEKWIERFVIKPKVMCSDDSASGDDPAGRSSDASSVASIHNQIPKVVCVQTVVSEKWMDRFVFDLIECSSVSRTSVVARTFGPAVSEEYSPVVFSGEGGGAVADAYPLVVVESATVLVSGLQLVESDAAQVSVLPVVGWKFPAVFWGKVAFDLVGQGDGPPCLRVDSEEILLTLTEEQAQLARAAPGVTPVDSSEKGVPVRELILPSVLGDPLADCLQEPMSGEKNLEYAIRTTASVWMPFEQVYRVESGDVDFDFGMAPWDAGGMYSQTLGEPYRTRMLQWLMRLLCRPVIMNGLIRTRTVYTENGLDTNMMKPTDSPRLTVTPGEWYENDVFTQIRHELQDAGDNSAAVDCIAVIRNNMISRRLCLPPEEVSARRYEMDDFPETQCTAAECDAADMNGLISRQLCLPPQSVCNRPVTGSHGFGSSHRLGQCCLWFAALHVHRIEYAEVPLSHHLLLVVLCHIHLRDAFGALFPPGFELILTFSYCLYDFLREQELGSGSPRQEIGEHFQNRFYLNQ